MYFVVVLQCKSLQDTATLLYIHELSQIFHIVFLRTFWQLSGVFLRSFESVFKDFLRNFGGLSKDFLRTSQDFLRNLCVLQTSCFLQFISSFSSLFFLFLLVPSPFLSDSPPSYRFFMFFQFISVSSRFPLSPLFPFFGLFITVSFCLLLFFLISASLYFFQDFVMTFVESVNLRFAWILCVKIN